jgi:hypothetical protein
MSSAREGGRLDRPRVGVDSANTNDSTMLEALLDDLPPTRTPAGQRRCHPDKVHADKAAHDHHRCRGYLSR